MKAQELNYTHLGKRVSVDNQEIVVAGTLLKITHTPGNNGVGLAFRGGINLQAKPDAEVEILDP